MLTVRALACGRGRVLLRGLSFDLRIGEVLGVLGANGAGKSTLLATLAGEIPPLEGEVRLHGKALCALNVIALARWRAVLPQSPELAFGLRLETLLAMGAYPFPEISPARLCEMRSAALQCVGLTGMEGRNSRALSGGERQRAQFARVWVQAAGIREISRRPPVLFLDEPIAGLDPQHQLRLLHMARELSRQWSAAVLVVLHDVNLAARFCDRVALLADGGMVALDVPVAVLKPALLARAYGADAAIRIDVLDARRRWVEFETPRAAP